jgi:hypothetical protein
MKDQTGYKRYYTVTAAKLWASAKKIALINERGAASRKARACADAFFHRMIAEHGGPPDMPDSYRDVYHNTTGANSIQVSSKTEGVLSITEIKRIMLDSYKDVVATPARDVALASKVELGRIADAVAGIAAKIVAASNPSNLGEGKPYHYAVPHQGFALEKYNKPGEATHVIILKDAANTVFPVKLTPETIRALENSDASPREVVFTWAKASPSMFERASQRNSEERKFAPFFNGNTNFYLEIHIRLEDISKQVATRGSEVVSSSWKKDTEAAAPVVATSTPEVQSDERANWQRAITQQNVKRFVSLGDRWLIASDRHSVSGKQAYYDTQWTANAFAHLGVSKYQLDYVIDQAVKHAVGAPQKLY